MDTTIKVYGNFHEAIRNNVLWEKEQMEEYKKYRRRWENNPIKAIVERAPIHLDIETSAICNLMCPMCFCTIERQKGDKAAYKGGLIPFERYKKIIDEASDIGVCSVKLNWRGEPLMNPDIVKMVRYAKEKGILEIMINTNAVFLSDKMSRELIKAGLDKIIFSVDSVHKERYEKIRIGANFEDTISNIKNFVQINNQLEHRVSTRVQRVLMNETDDEQQEFEEYFKDIIDVIAYEDYIPYGDKELGKRKSFDEYPNFRCPQIWQRLLITWEGKCFMCCCSSDEQFQIGDLTSDSIEEIWHSKKLEAVREFHKLGNWHKFEKCRNCYLPYVTS